MSEVIGETEKYFSQIEKKKQQKATVGVLIY